MFASLTIEHISCKVSRAVRNPKPVLTLLHFLLVGSKQGCADLYPRQLYTQGGRTEYTKLRINPRLLIIDTSDFTFSKTLGPNKIR